MPLKLKIKRRSGGYTICCDSGGHLGFVQMNNAAGLAVFTPIARLFVADELIAIASLIEVYERDGILQVNE